MPDTAAAKDRLEAQLVELEARSRIAEDLSEPLNPDSSEQAVEMEDDASLEGHGRLGRKGDRVAARAGADRGRDLRRMRPLRRGNRSGTARGTARGGAVHRFARAAE